jgi:hypothetical protein
MVAKLNLPRCKPNFWLLIELCPKATLKCEEPLDAPVDFEAQASNSVLENMNAALLREPGATPPDGPKIADRCHDTAVPPVAGICEKNKVDSLSHEGGLKITGSSRCGFCRSCRLWPVAFDLICRSTCIVFCEFIFRAWAYIEPNEEACLEPIVSATINTIARERPCIFKLDKWNLREHYCMIIAQC